MSSRLLSTRGWGCLVLGVFVLPACARGQGAAERHTAQLQEELRRVQLDHERLDRRVASLELRLSEDRPGGERATKDDRAEGAAPAYTDHARLRVVRLSPDGRRDDARGANDGREAPASRVEAFADGTDDSSPRPTIRMTGTGRRNDAIEQTMPDDGAAEKPRVAARPSALDPEAKRAYDAALAMVTARQYDRALEAFAGFLVRWPDHPNADNATYWRGECYFAQGEYARAAEQFDGTINRFPSGNKVPDAMLKLGMCQAKLGMTIKAKGTFERLANEFSRSDAARRIPREDLP